jgi:hypothetical protein
MIPTATVQKIYKYHERRDAAKPPRTGRLGASIIGHHCDRYMWYSFRKLFKKKFDGRMLRLFETGHLAEPRFVDELRGIGCVVEPVDPETGDQFMFTAHGGHFVCYLDAIIMVGVPEAPKAMHIGEFKTMGGTEDQKSKDFEKVQKEGVRAAKPEHYAQMMVGMGLSQIDRALYLACKKATDELYSERVRFDKDEYEQILARALTIINSIKPLERFADRPDDYRCKWCDARALCWAVDTVPLPDVTCRSCCHATPELDGTARWSCAKHEKDLTGAEQRAACDEHLIIPWLLNFAEVADAGEDWIEFKNTTDGAVWRHGKHDGMISTKELIDTKEATK